MLTFICIPVLEERLVPSGCLQRATERPSTQMARFYRAGGANKKRLWLLEERFWNTLQGEDLALARSAGCSSSAELELEKRKKEDGSTPFSRVVHGLKMQEKQRRMEEQRLQESTQQRQEGVTRVSSILFRPFIRCKSEMRNWT